jgi:hypothetical protein
VEDEQRYVDAAGTADWRFGGVATWIAILGERFKALPCRNRLPASRAML